MSEKGQESEGKWDQDREVIPDAAAEGEAEADGVRGDEREVLEPQEKEGFGQIL